jgi:hypothetical protein
VAVEGLGLHGNGLFGLDFTIYECATDKIGDCVFGPIAGLFDESDLRSIAFCKSASMLDYPQHCLIVAADLLKKRWG